MKIKKRFLAMLLTVCLSVGMLPQTAFATEEVTIGTGGLCEHHVTHDETCGYVEGIVGTPCAHEHTEACFKRTESCTHIHTADCYSVMGSAVSDNSVILSDVIEQVVCTHECSEESSCITEELNCIHAEHDNECGYIATVEGDDCHYECTECAAPTCTCEIGVQNRHATNCPVYAAPENPECLCDEKCTEGNIDIWCDICGFNYHACNSEHIHYVCGDVGICMGHPVDPVEQSSFQHDDNDNKSYAALLGTNNTTLSQGSYYLPRDLNVSYTINIEEEVNLCLNGRTLELEGGVNGSLFLIKNGGKLTLCDCKGGGKLVGNDVGSSVVTVATNGTFHMYSGTISGAESIFGGGVCIDGERSSFTMYGGMISGNTAKNGSGVYLNVGAFTMYDGTIDSNMAENGGVYINSGRFTMYDGMISNNTSENGGVYVADGEFFMEGGTISSNKAEHGGGVYVGTSGTVMLRDWATIKENTSNGNGGGVYVAGGDFFMEGGTISSNKAQYGGGVAVVGGISTMNAGIISSNEAQYGGGVAVIGGTFTVYGGTIRDNTAANSGGGVYMDSGTNTKFTVGGGGILENKKSSDVASNVYVVGGAPFNVENSLPSETIIYVDHGIGAVFTNGGLDENAVNYFISSDTNLLKVEQRVGDGALEIKLKEDSLPASHSHASCGVSCEQTDNLHAIVTYEALLTDDEIETGSYYLLADLQVAETITINAPVKLCLNGHELTLKSGLFRIGEGATLTLCDCKGGGRVIGALSNAGDLYIYGGTLAEISLENDGVVYLAEGAKFADNLLKVNFTGSEQIYADPDLLNTQKMALYLDESISTVPDGVVVRAWKADGSDSSFTSVNNFTLVRPVGYLLEPDNGAVVLSSSSGGSTAGVAGGSGGNTPTVPAGGGSNMPTVPAGGGNNTPTVPAEGGSNTPTVPADGGDIPSDTPEESQSHTPAETKTVSATVLVSGDENSIQVGAEVSGTKATIEKIDLSALNTVIGDHVEIGVVTIDFSALDKEIDTVEIPADVVKQITEAVNDPNNDAESLEIVFTDGISIEFDAKALGEKARQAGGLDITISIKHATDNTLNSRQQQTIGSRPALDINITSGGKHISDMGGKVSVHVPYELQTGEKAEGIVVFYVDDNGNREHCETTYDPVKKSVNWKTDHFSVYMIGYDESLEMAEQETVTEEITEEAETDEMDVPEETRAQNESFGTILLILVILLGVLAGLWYFLIYKKKKDVEER